MLPGIGNRLSFFAVFEVGRELNWPLSDSSSALMEAKKLRDIGIEALC